MLESAHATWLQVAAGSAATAVHASPDSIRMDTPPLPGGVASLFRFLFSGVPQWVQIAGVVVGAIGAVIVTTLAWRHRAAIVAWLSAQSHGYKMALGAGVGTTLLVAGLAGGWSYNYMMHDNDFCSSCHVMSTAFDKFQTSEHSNLECHACHQQSMVANAKELYYWVMDRPEKIPAHNPVPDRICADCHITQQRDSTWQYISATAGHQVHMESDSSALREVMCVSCHGKEVHAFAPADLSCKQSGCHDDVKVRLGKMADQTSLHCTTCHEFTRPVAETAPIDSARQGMVPLKPQCFTCHEMREALEKAGLDKDPHKARCGDCHNPHDQTKASGAVKTCQSAGCHASADTLTAFHRGLGTHALDDCVACHVAHTWKVESTDCIACHKTIFDDRPPTRALFKRAVAPRAPAPVGDRRVGYAPHAPLPTSPTVAPAQANAAAAGAHDGLPEPVGERERGRPRRGGPSAESMETEESTMADMEGWQRTPAPSALAQNPAKQAVRDSTRATRRIATSTQQGAARQQAAPFLHSRHRALKCESCHNSTTQHGQLTVRNPANCQECHHARDERAGSCSTCHAPAELTTPSAHTVPVRVTGRTASVTRSLTFEHARHARTACSSCHADNVARTVVKGCVGCHTDHHAVDRTCTACHPTPRAEHTRATHDGCASCHADATVAALPPVKGICLSCHAEQLTHYPTRECVTCHRVSWNEVARAERAR